MKIRNVFRVAGAVFHLVVGGITLLFVPKNYKPIYRGLKYFKTHASYQIAIRKLYEDPDFAELIRTRYNPTHAFDWPRMKTLPVGTLGRELYRFIDRPEVDDIAKFPGANDRLETSEEDYIRMRLRRIHDVHHVICGYPATVLGELGISAYYVALVNSPLSAMLMGLGIIQTVIKNPAGLAELMNVLTEGWQNGVASKNFMGKKVEELWDRPLDELRAEWNVTPSRLLSFSKAQK